MHFCITNFKVIKMIVRIWTKAQTQTTIKALRTAGYIVEKLNAGYECKLDNEVIFKAMIGTNGYLIRYKDGLFA